MTKLSPRLTNWLTDFEVAGEKRQMTGITNEHSAFPAAALLGFLYYFSSDSYLLCNNRKSKKDQDMRGT